MPPYPKRGSKDSRQSPLSQQSWLSHPQQDFWPDAISLLDPQRAYTSKLQNHNQITGSYLLALAVHRGGQLATLDAKLSPTAVPGGPAALSLILGE